MNIAKILLLALGIMTVVYMVYLVRDVVTQRRTSANENSPCSPDRASCQLF